MFWKNSRLPNVSRPRKPPGQWAQQVLAFTKAVLQCVLAKKRKVNSAFFLPFFRSFVQPTQVLSDVRSVKQTAGATWSVRAIWSLAKQRELVELFLERSRCHSLITGYLGVNNAWVHFSIQHYTLFFRFQNTA